MYHLDQRTIADKRIRKEYKDLIADPPANLSAGPINPDNMFEWECVMFGPADGPYAGGAFNLTIKFPPEYPSKPPRVKFATQIYHPNIGKLGDICVDFLNPDNWTSKYSITKVLIAVNCLLHTPNPKSCLNDKAGKDYLENPALFYRTAREWTANYARMG